MSTNDWSVPDSELHDEIRVHLDSGTPAVMATIVDVDGNAYRRPGAKMLIGTDETATGSITAGCLEEEVLEVARDVLDTGQGTVERYDLMADDDVWGLGLGCNGIIDVLLEPLDDTYRPLLEYRQTRRDCTLVTILDDPGDSLHPRALHDRERGWTVLRGEVPEELAEELEKAEAGGHLTDRSRIRTVELHNRSRRVFLDRIDAPPRALIFGSGHDVGPVVELANKNDFRTTVVGLRGSVDLEDQFPHADDILTTTPATLREDLSLDTATYAVIMTHRIVDDQSVLEQLVQTDLPYLGLMGPRKRFETIREKITGEAKEALEENLDRVYTPIGLDLGGGSPYGIATSIVAEMTAVTNNRKPVHLVEKEGPIHVRDSAS